MVKSIWIPANIRRWRSLYLVKRAWIQRTWNDITLRRSNVLDEFLGWRRRQEFLRRCIPILSHLSRPSSRADWIKDVALQLQNWAFRWHVFVWQSWCRSRTRRVYRTWTRSSPCRLFDVCLSIYKAFQFSEIHYRAVLAERMLVLWRHFGGFILFHLV